MLEMLGIGDLHFGSSLSQHLPSTKLHDFIISEIQTVLGYAKRNGVRNVVFYGDISHTPHLDPDSLLVFLHLLESHPEFNFIVMTGNHDIADSGHHSLRVLQRVARSWMSHVKVISSPKTLKLQGQRVNVLPWPHTETQDDALNILHVEVKGSMWDTGRPTGGTLSVPKSHFCVAGHLHTAQVVGSVHFSGTLYQTNFAEKLPKYFHHIKYDHDNDIRQVKLVPHQPKYTLHNIIIKATADLEKIPSDPTALCKIFVKKGVDLDPSELSKRPNVVKFNSFQNKQELEVLINEDLYLEDDSAAVQFDTRIMLKDWLKESKVQSDLAKRAIQLYDRITNQR